MNLEYTLPLDNSLMGLGSFVMSDSGTGIWDSLLHWEESKQQHNCLTGIAIFLYESLSSIPKIRIYGPLPSQNVHRAALCSFNVDQQTLQHSSISRHGFIIYKDCMVGCIYSLHSTPW